MQRYNAPVPVPAIPWHREEPSPIVNLAPRLLWRRLGAVFIVSWLLSALSVILPIWGPVQERDFGTITNGALTALLAAWIAQRLSTGLRRRAPHFYGGVLGCLLATAALLSLSLTRPPVPAFWRYTALGLMGLGIGFLLNYNLPGFHSTYQRNPLATVNLIAVAWGLGALLPALLVGVSMYNVTASTLFCLLALVPAYGLQITALPYTTAPTAATGDARAGRRSLPGNALFALLLAIECGTEWAVGGWLATFLVQSLGFSPDRALLLLALYWLVIFLGRTVAQSRAPVIGTGTLIIARPVTAFLGCAFLTGADNLLFATLGTVLLGGSNSLLLPVILRRSGHRFLGEPSTLLRRLMLVAVTGALLGIWFAGYIASVGGIRRVMLSALVGGVISFLVCSVLLLEIRLEEWTSGRAAIKARE